MADGMPQLVEQGGGVVGAVGQPEALPAAQAPAVAPLVEGDHPVVLAQRVEGLEPVQAGAGDPAVEQQHGRGVPVGPGTSRTKVMPRPGSSMRRPKGSGGPAAPSSRMLVTLIAAPPPVPVPRYASARRAVGRTIDPVVSAARAGTYLAGRWPAAQSQRAVSARVSAVGRSGVPEDLEGQRVVARLPAGQVVHALPGQREVDGHDPHEHVVDRPEAPQHAGRHRQAPDLAPATSVSVRLSTVVDSVRPPSTRRGGGGSGAEQGDVQVGHVTHVDDGPAPGRMIGVPDL